MTLKYSEAAMFSRVWAMPKADTFDIPPIAGFVRRYLMRSKISVDPFARNKRWATYTNDLNPATAAEYHLHAEDFLRMLAAQGVRCDLALFDPPYSPRQISECYKEAGIPISKCFHPIETSGAMYSKARSALAEVLTDNAVVMSFGWNSAGMGKQRGFEILEVMLVCHGGAHHDTICLAERRRANLQGGLL
jgi:hypothetical protein